MATFKKPSLAGHGLLGTKIRPNVSPGEIGFSAGGGGGGKGGIIHFFLRMPMSCLKTISVSVCPWKVRRPLRLDVKSRELSGHGIGGWGAREQGRAPERRPGSLGCFKPLLRLPWGLLRVKGQGTLTSLSPGFLVGIRAREINPINPHRAKILKKDSLGA